MPWRNFPSPEFGTVPGVSTLFWRYPNFLITQVVDSWKEAAVPKAARFVQLFRLKTGFWRTDRRTDT